jgi:hypothetical protein
MPNKQSLAQKPGLTVAIGAITAILALIAIGLYHAAPPDPLPSAVSATLFSSGRAMSHVRHIAQQPHPTGTPENAEVRDYLLAELKALGLDAQIQTALGVNGSERFASVGIVHNILARVPGRTPGKALLLAAHYDSTPAGPGAADDGASVAAILETLRALKTQPALRNDLICIFTDGEEAGLLGAEAFVAEHSWAKDIGAVLNFEYRGNRGPVVMFETSQGNGKLVDGFATAAPHPLGNSLMYEVYKRLPNDTDMTVFKRAGIPGMNFAAIEGHTHYHTQLDRPEFLHEGSLQHQGEILLALAQHFGNVPLDNLRSEDSVYFDAPGLGLVNYSVSRVLPLCGAAILLFGAVSVLGLKSGELRAARMALGALEFLLVVPLLAGTCRLLWAGIRYLHPEYAAMAQGDTYNSHWYLLAFAMLTIGLYALVQSGTRSRIRPLESTMGAMACWLIMLAVASIGWPGVSFLFFWPLAPELLAFGVLFWRRGGNRFSPLCVAIMLLGAAPGILMYAPLVKLLFIALTPQQTGVAMAFLAMLLGLSVPLVDLLARRLFLQWLAPAAAVLFLAIASFTAGFDTRHPRPNNLFYGLDGATGKAFWLSADKTLDAWTKTFFPDHPVQRQVPEILGDGSGVYWVAPAPVFALQAPGVEVLEDGVASGIRKITIRVRSLRHAPKLNVVVEGAGVLASKVQGRLFSQTLRQAWRLKSFGMAGEGLVIELHVQADATFKIRVIDFSYELPRTNLPSRPSGMIPRPFGLSDTTAAVKTIAFK